MGDIIKILDRYGSLYVSGTLNTLWFAFITVIFGTLLGTVIAIMKLSKSKILNGIVSIYVEVLRGTPLLLQMYFFWLFLPKVIPFDFGDIVWVLIALIVNSSAYVAEIIRAGIQAVDKGQTEAARSLGISEGNIMRRIILPQAIKNILPALGNEFVMMIKETSLASTFFAGELMTVFKTVQSNTFLAIPPLVIAGMIYLTITFTLSRVISVFERRMAVSD